MFEEDQYVIGDFGYQALPHLVCVLKRAVLVSDEDFNTCMAKCRVTNEHCIGVLKSCWHSLKEIRVQLNSKIQRTMPGWFVGCCCVQSYITMF